MGFQRGRKDRMGLLATAPAHQANRWRGRPIAAAVVKSTVVVVPGVAAVAVTALLNYGVDTPTRWTVRIGWWLLLLAISTVVALAVESQTRRLLPLAVLLKLTLLFPDEAPSRYAVARAASNPTKLRDLAVGGSPRSRAAMHVLALVAELAKHDRHTRGHSERVRVFSDLIAEQLQLSRLDREKLRWAALLHDIGKLRVPAKVLNKAGKPSEREWETLRGHPAAGLTLVGPLGDWLGAWAGGIGDHHERYDGTGYPSGLAGDAISLAGRIVAVADSFETMTATRAYKRPIAAAAGRAELARCAGSHFDPMIVRAFLAIGLPRMLRGVGPLSFLLHLPFLSRLPEAGLGLVSVASQAATPVVAVASAGALATATVASPVAATLVEHRAGGGTITASGPAKSGVVGSSAMGFSTGAQPTGMGNTFGAIEAVSARAAVLAGTGTSPGDPSPSIDQQGPTNPVPDGGSPGSKGKPVPKGSSGSNGNSGSKGNSGSNGNSGSKGSTGSKGTSGSEGSAGSKGSSGPSSSGGSTGSKGNSGSPGSSGSKGNSGSKGSSGAEGGGATKSNPSSNKSGSKKSGSTASGSTASGSSASGSTSSGSRGKGHLLG